MSIRNNIKELRESRNLTQAEFGKIAGVSDKAVSTWENGTAEPRMGAIQKIADYFGVTKGWIVDDDSSSLEAATPPISDDEQRILDMYRALDPDDRAEVRGFVKGLLAGDKYKDASIGSRAI